MPTPLTAVERHRFETVVLPQLPALHVRARHLARSPVEAQDLVQDTLERAIGSFSRFQDGNVLPWLGTIMLHQFIDGRRKGTRQGPTHTFDEARFVAPEPEPLAPSSQLTDAHVRTALERLTPAFRDIGTLHFFGGCSQREISQRLNLPVGTVGTRVMRTKQKLRALLARGTLTDAAVPA